MSGAGQAGSGGETRTGDAPRGGAKAAAANRAGEPKRTGKARKTAPDGVRGKPDEDAAGSRARKAARPVTGAKTTSIPTTGKISERRKTASSAAPRNTPEVTQPGKTRKAANSAAAAPAPTTGGFARCSLERALGKRTATALAKLGLETVADLLYHFPRRYETFAQLTPLDALVEGEDRSFVAEVVDRRVARSARNPRLCMLNVTLSDGHERVGATFFARSLGMLKGHEARLAPGVHALLSGRVGRFRGRWQLQHPAYQVLEDRGATTPADVERLAATPTPIYPATKGVPTWRIEAAVGTVLDTLRPADVPDPLPVDVRRAEGLPGLYDALTQIHRPARSGDDALARRRFRFQEAFVLQVALARMRLAERARTAPRCAPRAGGIYDAVLGALPFALTEGQTRAAHTLTSDMDSTTPMSVLLQGDVGSGKTVVALLAAARALDAGRQAALLAPTEVLAYQHHRTIVELLGARAGKGLFGGEGRVPVELLTSSSSSAERRDTLATLASGTPALVVGTHALLADAVSLPGLGLVIVDEQHRFGVNQRDRLLGSAGERPHMLVMTATPIPRTVAMTVFGDLDTLVLPDVPARRAGVQTFVVPRARAAWVERVWQRAAEEVGRGGRVFVVCPRIDSQGQGDRDEDGAPARASVDEVARALRATPALRGIDIGVLHGRLGAAAKDRALADFASGETPVLVSTTVIEVGVDVAQATMMVIEDADFFGLSQLHQLRGRIGRGDKPGVCMALTAAEPDSPGMARLEAFATLTDGFALAQADLQLRSEGDILGESQSGRRSGLRLLSVCHDQGLIAKARRAAGALVRDDPQLSAHPALRAALAELAPEQQAYLARG